MNAGDSACRHRDDIVGGKVGEDMHKLASHVVDSVARNHQNSLGHVGTWEMMLPSGKLPHNELERSTIFNGKIHYR